MTRSDLESTTKLVLHTLHTFVDREGVAWPSIATIARAAGLSSKATGQHPKKAEAFGWIKRTVHSTTQLRHRYEYILSIPASVPPSFVPGPKTENDVPSRTAARSHSNRNAVPTNKLTFSNPSNNTGNEVDDSFDEFWDACTAHPDSKRDFAYALWRTLSDEVRHRALLSAVGHSEDFDTRYPDGPARLSARNNLPYGIVLLRKWVSEWTPA